MNAIGKVGSLDIKGEVTKVIDDCLKEKSYPREAMEDAQKVPPQVHDSVHHPKHYELAPGIEAIDVIRAVTGDGFAGYCRGNALKYLVRADHKGGIEDLRKAMVYIQWEIEAREAKR